MAQQHRLLAYLEAGIPLRLLLDLACPDGPDSRAIYSAEERLCSSSDFISK